MSLAWISLIALVLAVVVGIVMRINVGLLAFAAAYIVGYGFGGMSASDVTSGFPTGLFVVLVAVMLLFSLAQVNGTLQQIATHTVKLARGNVGMVPIVFFGLTVVVATLGAGNIAGAALIAPIAMAAAGRMGISAFLMVIMVGNGANAGAYSPIAPTGIVASELMAQAGLPGVEWETYWNTFAAQTFVAFAGYFTLGGLGLIRSGRRVQSDEMLVEGQLDRLDTKQWLTVGVIAALLVAVILFQVNIVVGAFVGVGILLLARAADEEEAVKSVPWSTIMMICGVSTLVQVLAETGGVDMIVDGLVAISTPRSVTAVVAFVSGIISAYSSTVGVVLPTFLPTVPGLAEQLGADPLAIASSMNVGGHLVDVSPVSTIGAICIAAAASTADRKDLFNKVLAWGLSMSVVGAIVCWIFFGLL